MATSRPDSRTRAVPVGGVSAGAARGVLVQGVGLLPELRRPSHDRARSAPGRLRIPGCAGAAVGADAVVIVQRFESALNLNVHLHALVLDAVFPPEGDGRDAVSRSTDPPGT